MCDIWKGNKNLKQLERADIEPVLKSLLKLNIKQVLFSGGEAMLHPLFFDYCKMFREEGIYVSVHSTGLTLERHASLVKTCVDELIISLDGDRNLHDEIRDIPGAFEKLRKGIQAIRMLDPHFPISGRTVIHRLNFRLWPSIIKAAKEIGLDRISFLPADVSSEAFNRPVVWDADKQNDIAIPPSDLTELENITEKLIEDFSEEIRSHFIAEPADKLRAIHQYYAAWNGLCDYPFKKCNAPWVSVVIEPDGNVRPCFFHKVIGNIKEHSLDQIINGKAAIEFRRNLDMRSNETCRKCVCTLNLHPTVNPGRQ